MAGPKFIKIHIIIPRLENSGCNDYDVGQDLFLVEQEKPYQKVKFLVNRHHHIVVCGCVTYSPFGFRAIAW